MPSTPSNPKKETNWISIGMPPSPSSKNAKPPETNKEKWSANIRTIGVDSFIFPGAAWPVRGKPKMAPKLFGPTEA